MRELASRRQRVKGDVEWGVCQSLSKEQLYIDDAHERWDGF